MKALRQYKNTYIKTRVIAIAYDLPETISAMITAPWDEPEHSFVFNDPKKYFEARYLTYALDNWSVNKSEFTKTELEKFNEGENALRKFQNLDKFIGEVADFRFEFFTFYTNLMRETQTSTIFGSNPNSYQDSIEGMKDLLERYKDALDKIEYKDWRDKFEEEIGNYLHLIYTNHCLEKDQHLFDGFNLQRFFK